MHIILFNILLIGMLLSHIYSFTNTAPSTHQCIGIVNNSTKVHEPSIIFSVTDIDIESGGRNISNHNPVARALKQSDSTIEDVFINVYYGIVYIDYTGYDLQRRAESLSP